MAPRPERSRHRSGAGATVLLTNGHTLAGRVGDQHPSLLAGSCDDPRARRLDLPPHPSRQLRRSHNRERRPALSTGGPAAISRSTSAPAPGPYLLDLALTPLGGLAGQPRHCPARNRPRLAPPRLPAL